MIKKLQLRFVCAVMEAFLAVLLLVLVGVNCANRHNVYRSIDSRLSYLAESTLGPPLGMVASTPQEIRRWVDLNRAGVMSESSYFIFSAHTPPEAKDQQLRMLSIAMDADAEAVLNGILQGRDAFGNCGQYRYYAPRRGADYKVVFLACENEFSAMRSLLRASFAVGAVCLVLVLAMAVLLSRKATAPFVQNMESQKRFISNASHELKTPLGVIISDLDMQILESGSSEWLENAQLQADHLTLLIDQLITYSLLEEKGPRTADAPVDISALGEAALADFRPLALSRGQRLSGRIAPGVSVRGNADALRTLLSVLLDNAVKYTPEGGAICLAIRQEKRAVVELQNTCGDMSEAELSRLFERFYRAPQHRAAQQGSGLGLSIARDIAALYGGGIRAARRGKDIVFTAEF